MTKPHAERGVAAQLVSRDIYGALDWSFILDRYSYGTADDSRPEYSGSQAHHGVPTPSAARPLLKRIRIRCRQREKNAKRRETEPAKGSSCKGGQVLLLKSRAGGNSFDDPIARLALGMSMLRNRTGAVFTHFGVTIVTGTETRHGTVEQGALKPRTVMYNDVFGWA
ncbi:hypothetical protein G7046_g3445 [Stylonectria norvegica]|nr:hypothetical protein G7046_g3445 [Stylonectria norvegica]